MKTFARIASLTHFASLSWRRVAMVGSLVAVLWSLASLPAAQGQQSNEKTFASPGEAAQGLYKAAQDNDQAALSAIFGTSANELLHSGDQVADKKMAADFLRRYDEMHRVVIEPDGTATVYVGADNWPLPISIVKTSSGTWYFDVDNGKREILYRRIGTNENDAIEVCHALVQAEHEYASVVRSGEASRLYALKFVSDEGKQDGLFWKVAPGEPSSPIGPLVADATSEGYTRQKDKTPFHGYYFRILDKQRTSSKAGMKESAINGTLARGFAFLAYPAQYKNSGVMTFVVNQDGIVYQKDLGPETESIASAMTEYNPDATWDRVDE